MNIIVTGAAGFLGSRIVDILLSECSKLPIKKVLLVDTVEPNKRNDSRVRYLAIDLTAPTAAEKVIQKGYNIIFHLAAIVSGQAEADFDHGLRTNFDVTRALLERIRHLDSQIKFIFTSSLGVFGGNIPNVIDDLTAVTPQNSYGTQKAMCELLINDYSRRGFIDGRVLRLPTISVRPGTANQAVTSFASGIIREPLNGEVSVCPVKVDLELWLSSPETVTRNIIHAAMLPQDSFRPWCVINLPGITVSVKDMIKSLVEIAGKEIEDLIHFKYDKAIDRIASTFPSKFNNSRALNLGFNVDKNFSDIIKCYIRVEMKNIIPNVDFQSI